MGKNSVNPSTMPIRAALINSVMSKKAPHW
jgi:hypothetical protein